MQDASPWSEPAESFTPKQDRLESAIRSALVEGHTRTTLRFAVEELTDLLRRQGVSAERTVARMRAVVSAVVPGRHRHLASDLAALVEDETELAVQWCVARFHRGD